MWYAKAVSGWSTLLGGRGLPLLLLAGAFFLTSCATQERIVYRDRPVEVKVPVPVMPQVPDELRAPIQRPNVTWVAPKDGAAAICLSDRDAAALRAGVWSWLRRIEAWEQWASPLEVH